MAGTSYLAHAFRPRYPHQYAHLIYFNPKKKNSIEQARKAERPTGEITGRAEHDVEMV